MRDSSKMWLNTISAKQAEFRSAVSELMTYLAGEDAELKEWHVQETYKKAAAVRDLLSSEDAPRWLEHCLAILSSSRANYPRHQLLKDLIPFIATIDLFRWESITPDSESGIDFDEIYSRHKSASTVDELFDRIIAHLQKLIESNAIDSIRVVSALEHLIATIRRSKSGSYLSAMAGWQFLCSFFKNLIFEQIKSIPVLGPILAALESTMIEMNTELGNLHERISSEIQSKHGSDFPTLSYNRFGSLELNPNSIHLEQTV